VGKQELSIILKNLPCLSLDELEKVKQRVSILVGVSFAQADAQDWLLLGITEELRRRGLWLAKYPIPAKLLPNKFAEKSKALQEFLLKGFGQLKPQRAECLSLATISTRALADWMDYSRIPVTPRTVLFNVDKIPIALEQYFPGYWAQGLLGMILGKPV